MRITLRRSLAAVFLLASGLGLLATPAPADASPLGAEIYPEVPTIIYWRDVTWDWNRVMSAPLARFSRSEVNDPSPAFRNWVLNDWKRRAQRTKARAVRPPHRAAWGCIHRYEGSWTDPNPPYYGGLQMDARFMHAYAPRLFRRKGTADHWTPLEQMWAAEKAVRRVGFSAWPHSARMCGLL